MLLLCSDGLCGPVSADDIRVALTRSDPQQAAERLILEARRQGGPDNITAVVVRVDEGAHGDEETTLVRPADAEADVVTGEPPFVVVDDSPTGAEPGDAADALAALRAEHDEGSAPADPVAAAARRRKRSVRRLGIVAAALGLLAAALAAGAFFLSTVFFIGVDDGASDHLQRRARQGRPHPAARRLPAQRGDLRLALAAGAHLVDEQQLRDREDAITLSRMLGMWP